MSIVVEISIPNCLTYYHGFLEPSLAFHLLVTDSAKPLYRRVVDCGFVVVVVVVRTP
jgi:hypothetical protein